MLSSHPRTSNGPQIMEISCGGERPKEQIGVSKSSTCGEFVMSGMAVVSTFGFSWTGLAPQVLQSGKSELYANAAWHGLTWLDVAERRLTDQITGASGAKEKSRFLLFSCSHCSQRLRKCIHGDVRWAQNVDLQHLILRQLRLKHWERQKAFATIPVSRSSIAGREPLLRFRFHMSQSPKLTRCSTSTADREDHSAGQQLLAAVHLNIIESNRSIKGSTFSRNTESTLHTAGISQCSGQNTGALWHDN